jgi:predicted acyl esterase
LDLYVAKRVPTFDAGLRLVAPELFRAFFEEPLALPENRFADYTSYADALADYEAEPPLRVVFESGANPELDKPGAPLGTFEQHFEAWPIPGTKATRFFLQPGGGLAAQAPPQGGGGSSFEHDAEAGKRTSLAAEVGSSDEVWKTAPRYDYRPLVEGKAIAFESEPLAADVVMLGHGSADLFLQSTADDADLEITLTEVRADGNESYVQSGFLRASQRKLRADASDLRPTHTHREEDVAPLPRGQWELVRVELMPFGHVFRAGSRIRLSVDTPGDNHAAWTFILLEHEGTPVHTVAHDAAHPSSLVLPVVEGVEIPSSTPPCEALRGQPCRAHVAVKNAPM